MFLRQNLWLLAAAVACVSAVPARAETFQVMIDKLVYSPVTINAQVGDTIEWINKDVFAHTATVKGGWEVMIPARETARMVLQTAESVDYYCRFHPNMKARIIMSTQ